MRKDAEAHAAEDKKRRELVDVRNQADSAAYAAEKLLKDNAAKLDPTERGAAETKIGELRKLAESSDDVAKIQHAMQELDAVRAAVAREGPPGRCPGRTRPARRRRRCRGQWRVGEQRRGHQGRGLRSEEVSRA